MNPLRAGVIGVGHLGSFHAAKYTSLPDVDLIAVTDTNQVRAEQVAIDNKTSACNDYRELLNQLDLVSIAVPTEHHYQIARDFLDAGVHVLLEKPITSTLPEAEELINLAQQHHLVFQIGHLERFNPAFQAVMSRQINPSFIESHRLAPYNDRGTDVDVILDLMIHDIDIILSVVKSPLMEIRASGMPLLSNAVDIANARLEFTNGCVANVTASRISNKHMRKMRIFQRNNYFSIDFHTRQLALHYAGESDGPLISIEEQTFSKGDPLLEEIRAFVHAIRTNTAPVVTAADGKRALQVALEIGRLIAVPDTSPSMMVQLPTSI